jgi:uncharacterized membrane protein
MNNKTSTSFEKYLAPFLLALNAAISLPFAYALNIWTDEASTMESTRGGFLQSWNLALADERQAPLYFALIGALREINDSVFFVRLFSIACSLAAIKFFSDAAKIYLPENARGLTVAAFALHPFLILQNTEARGYTMTVLLAVLLLKFFHKGFSAEKEDRLAQVVYLLLAIVSLYTNYYLGFVLAGNFLALLTIRRWRAAGQYLCFMAAAAAFVAPLFISFTQQFSTNSQDYLGTTTLFVAARNCWQLLQTFILPLDPYSDEVSAMSVARLWLVRAGVLALIVGFLLKRPKNISNELLTLLAILVGAAAFLVLAHMQIGIRFVQIRHAAVIFPVTLLLVFVAANEIFTRRGVWLWSALLAVFIPYSLFTMFTPLAKRGDWARVAEYVQQNESAGQPIVVFQTYDIVGFRHYYRGQNPILPDGKVTEWSFEADFGQTNTNRSEIEFVISQIPANSRQIWLLTGDLCDNPKTTASCASLQDFIDAYYTVISEQNFHLEKARLLERK